MNALGTRCCWFWMLWVQDAVDSERSGYKMLLILNALGTRCCWFRTLWVQDAVDSERSGYKMLLIPNALGTRCCWFWTLWVQDVVDSERSGYKMLLILNALGTRWCCWFWTLWIQDAVDSEHSRYCYNSGYKMLLIPNAQVTICCWFWMLWVQDAVDSERSTCLLIEDFSLFYSKLHRGESNYFTVKWCDCKSQIEYQMQRFSHSKVCFQVSVFGFGFFVLTAYQPLWDVKAIFVKAERNKDFHTFSKCIRPKVDVIAWLKFELVYYNVEVQNICHYAKGTTLRMMQPK